jgi:hypothetical protein
MGWDVKKLMYNDSILYKVGSKKDVEQGIKKLGFTKADEIMEAFKGKFYRHKNTYFVNEWALWNELR